jgi:uncharacterized membrane protein
VAVNILPHPAVRTIETKELKDALARGFDDFKTKPTHVVFLSIIYPIVPFVLARLTLKLQVLPLLFPLIAGFTFDRPIRRDRLVRTEPTSQAVFRGLVATLGIVLTATFLAFLQPSRCAAHRCQVSELAIAQNRRRRSTGDGRCALG